MTRKNNMRIVYPDGSIYEESQSVKDGKLVDDFSSSLVDKNGKKIKGKREKHEKQFAVAPLLNEAGEELILKREKGKAERLVTRAELKAERLARKEK